MNTFGNGWISGVGRHAGRATRGGIWVLPGTVHRHHLQYPHSTSNSLLRLQPHHSVRAHLHANAAHLHPASGRGREDRTR